MRNLKPITIAWTLLTLCAPAIAQLPAPGVARLQEFSDALVDVSARVKPGVVTVFSEKVVNATNPFEGMPFQDPFFRRFFQMPEPRGERREQGLGSGVIVSKEGYVLTNNHVIDGAEKIRVELSDDRSFDAKVVGKDPKSDVAVLKIEGKNLPVVPFGNSDDLRVGEWVLALGNPFGLQHTVTAGIVSAVGRGNVGIVDYEDFIQTDAAINPGNSGGALVNLRGELVGINTAIATRSGGYQGVGFAIPINMARNILDQLVETGRVSRGFLGVIIQDIDENLADAMGLDGTRGVLIGEVQEDSPAEKAGIERGDVVLSVDGRDVGSTDELRNRIAQTLPGTDVRLKVLRNGKERTIRVKLGELDQDSPVTAAESVSDVLGMDVQAMTPDLAARLGVNDADGVVVTDVKPGGPAQRGGIRRGDLVIEVNRKPVRSVKDYGAALKGVGKGDSVLLLVRRGGRTFFVGLQVQG